MGMNATERKELRNLVKADFDDARSFVRDLASQAYNNLDDELQKQLSARKVDIKKLTDEADEILADFNASLRKLYDKAIAQGFDVSYGFQPAQPHTLSNAKSYSIPKYNQVRSTERDKINEELSVAIREVDRRERSVQKQLFISALETEDARKFLESIPTPQEMLGSGKLLELATASEDENDA